jgi:hypothetical protein
VPHNPELTAKLYLSKNQKIRYIFVEDAAGRATCVGAEVADAPISSFGNRTEYLDVTGIVAPLIEYAKQTPTQYGGSELNTYISNWAYVRELPLTKLYYEQTDRALPPS